MSRRKFLQTATVIFGTWPLFSPAQMLVANNKLQWKTLRTLPVAGFQYYRGETLSALITGLKKSHNPWERIEVEVRWFI